MDSSTLKLLIPYGPRKFLRDLDSAYQERLKEVDIKNQQIADLEITNRRLVQELKSKEQELKSKEQDIQEIKNKFTISDKDYDHLSRMGIFIVGCARSGTSILCDCLNQSPEMLLLGEAHFYLHHQITNFVDIFNQRHAFEEHPRHKGTFIPPANIPENSGFDILFRMSNHYKYVGEKIVFGPHGKYGNEYVQELFFNFHATYFYSSKYILIMRRPTEAIWSMLKMFPDRSLNSIIECWLKSIKIQIDVFHVFPNAYILFFENLNLESIINLCSIMGIDIRISQGMIREQNRYSLLAPGEIPEQLAKYAKICLDCEEIYQQIKSEINPDTYKFKDTAANYGNAWAGFSYSIQKKMTRIIDVLSSFKD
jgi:hypothetical protein